MIKKILFFILVSLFVITPVYAENHKVTLSFDTNGGVLGSEHSNKISLVGSTIYKDNSIYYMYIVYGNTLTNTGLPNYNDPKAINIVRNGYHINPNEEWNTKPDGTGTTYSQNKVYKGTDFCSARYNDCSVKLYLKWVKDPTVEVRNVNISATSKTLLVGESISLSASVVPDNATNKQLTWSSSNSVVVSVDQNGRIIANSIGEANITVKASNGVNATCHVSVSKPQAVYAVSIRYNINGASYTIRNSHFSFVNGILYKDNSVHYTYITYGNKLSESGLVNYNSTNLFVLSKSGYYVEKGKEWINKENGKVYNQDLVYRGTDFCSAKEKDCSVTLSINWKKKKRVDKIKLNNDNVSIEINKSKKLNYTYASGSKKIGGVEWSSSDSSVVSVDKVGRVTGRKVGNAVITVKSDNGSKDSCVVTVKKPATKNNLSVGYSKVTISPNLKNYKNGIVLRGYGTTAKVDNQNSRSFGLYATAIAIKDKNGKKILFISTDLAAIELDEDSKGLSIGKIIDEISNYSDVPKDNIFISVTHTHSAPDLRKDTKYNDFLIAQLKKASQSALNDLSRISSIYRGSIPIDKMNFVRHYKTNVKDRFGNDVINGANYGSYYTEGEKTKVVQKKQKIAHASKYAPDNNMELIRFTREGKKDILLVNWQAHPAISGGSTTISADFVGPFRNSVSKKNNCLVAYFTGAAGDLNWNTELESEGKADVTYYKDNGREEPYRYKVTKNYGENLAIYVNNNYNKLKLDDVTLTSTIAIKNNSNEFDYIKNPDNVDIKTAKKIYKYKKYEIKDINSVNEFLKMLKEDSQMKKVVDNDEDLSKYFNKSFNKNNLNLNTFKTKVAKLARKAGYELPNNSIIQSKYHLTNIIKRNRKNDSVKITVNSIKIGNLYFATAPYEMFNINGKTIKDSNDRASSTTFIMELTNGKIGYIPSIEAYDYGCYEATITPVERGTGEELQNQIINNFERMRKDNISYRKKMRENA